MAAADPVIFIVKRLNEELKGNLSLVDFDEKSPLELLQLLKDVLGIVDDSFSNAKEEVRDDVNGWATKMVHMLHMLKFKVTPDLIQSVASGEKNVVYPILHWLLERVESHKKRAYIARFLYPVDVPQDYTQQDEVLQEKYNQYKQLQEEFKRAHRAAEAARARRRGAKPLESEIATLSDEKKQLETKIERLSKQNSDTHDFESLLEATKNLRLKQDEEARLSENMRKQRIALQDAENRKREASSQLEKLRGGRSVLDQLREEVASLDRKVRRDLPRELDAKKARLARFSGAADDKTYGRDDCENLRNRVEDRERRLKATKERIEDAMDKRDDGKLSNFRHHAQLIARKMRDAESKIMAIENELGETRSEIERCEDAAAMQHNPSPSDGTAMTRGELKRFGAELRAKTQVYKTLKTEASELRAESVVLHRTEQILRGKVANLEVFLSDLEAKRGVSGYRETRDKLESTAELTSELDQTKEKTLEEISDTVRKITADLKTRKNELAPQIKKLRELRSTYQDVESDFRDKKSTYDKIAVSLDVERQRLETECDDYQQQALREESSFHYLTCLCQMAQATLQRLRDEEKWTSSNHSGRGLLPNFKSYHELYTNKLAQQQAFADQLRKQRTQIEKNEASNMKQRASYLDLQNILQAKVSSINNTTAFADNVDESGESKHIGGADVYQLL